MITENNIYYITIGEDEELGLDAIALVDVPAVSRNFLCFNDVHKKLTFTDDEKHIITGVALLADTPIYRYSEDKGEWYVVFTPEVIQDIVTKYVKDGLMNKVNLQHRNNDKIEGMVMVESYFIDHNRNILPTEFKDVPDGSWIVSYKVTDVDTWNRIKNDDSINGFSVQGLFDIEKKPVIDEENEFLSNYL